MNVEEETAGQDLRGGHAGQLECWRPWLEALVGDFFWHRKRFLTRVYLLLFDPLDGVTTLRGSREVNKVPRTFDKMAGSTSREGRACPG